MNCVYKRSAIPKLHINPTEFLTSRRSKNEFKMNEEDIQIFRQLLTNISNEFESGDSDAIFQNLSKLSEVLAQNPAEVIPNIENSSIPSILLKLITSTIAESLAVSLQCFSNLLQLNSSKIRLFFVNNNIYQILNNTIQLSDRTSPNILSCIKSLINLFDFANHCQANESSSFVQNFISSVDFPLLSEVSQENRSFAVDFIELLNRILTFCVDKPNSNVPPNIIESFMNFCHNTFEAVYHPEDLKIVSLYLKFITLLIHINYFCLTQIDQDIMFILERWYPSENMIISQNVLSLFIFIAQLGEEKDDNGQKIMREILKEIHVSEIKESILEFPYCVKHGFMLLMHLLINIENIWCDPEFQLAFGYAFVFYPSSPFTDKTTILSFIICAIEIVDIEFLNQFADQICEICSTLIEDHSQIFDKFIGALNRYVTKLVCEKGECFENFKECFIKHEIPAQFENCMQEYDEISNCMSAILANVME